MTPDRGTWDRAGAMEDDRLARDLARYFSSLEAEHRATRRLLWAVLAALGVVAGLLAVGIVLLG